ncbi:leucyl aminopeptidase family protein [Kutzneria kofuensis]|uniref:Probable cytosol aminopeptidase n=1 Tax=Kutzneria kofuensis TaxID=103725 RepID=A0A7W9KFH5_9PSEU|nr:M17 family peptidase N-terminal domain-containing protein [Kutzneria kofuensis]MBB5891661.1 leucyl aminopeptidase [Kutzneria kofuensis]
MRSTAPAVPTPLPAIEVAATPHRSLPAVVVVADGPDYGPGRDRLDDAALATFEPTGKTGEVRQIGRNWLVGVGDGAARDWRSAGAALVRAADEREVGRYQVLLPENVTAEQAGAFALGLALGGYKFKVTGDTPAARTKSVLLVTPASVADAVAEAVTLAAATALTRDLANTPSNVKDPAWLVGTAARLAAGVTGLTAEVRDEAWLAEQGFGGVLAVGGGSSRPPRFVELTWRPRGSAKAPHLVFVGKGITFDTGGISIKPADGMHLMRTDMAGGAAVIAALLAVAALKLPLRVTGLVPCAENHVSGSAYRPGDVVRHYGGKTTEVANTDAEGRMVLADAMTWAVRKHSPDVLVDVATLTGAMKVSLGVRTGGLFATSDELAAQLITAGEQVGEAHWRMPLLEDLADSVRSEIADVKQTPGGPGAIAAALFLREFRGDVPWAHLDIAGPARSETTYDEVVPGATGFAARTLVRFAQNYR